MFKYLTISFLIIISFSSCNKDYGLNGKTFFDDSENKLWRHRVNSINEANNYLETFSGVEVDVFYDKKSNSFYVTHDEDYDINNTSTLKEYFSSIDNVSDHYYWIDFKNLNWLNYNKSIERMIELFDHFSLKEKGIIESANHRFLKKFNEEGLYTCYWVSSTSSPSYNGELNEESKKQLNEVEKILKECPHNALSTRFENIMFLIDNFPDQNIHIWTNGLITEEDKELINSFKLFSNVKVILIDYENPF